MLWFCASPSRAEPGKSTVPYSPTGLKPNPQPVPLRHTPMNNTQKQRIANGLCRQCGKPRAPDGTTVRCRTCAQKTALQSRQAKARRRAGIPNPPGRPKKTKTPSPSTRRATLAKRRRKLGLYPVASILTEEHLDALVKLEFLPADHRSSKSHIADAIAQYLDKKLVQDFQHTAWAKLAREQRIAARSNQTSKPQPMPAHQHLNAYQNPT